jgi:hypothetical protein
MDLRSRVIRTVVALKGRRAERRLARDARDPEAVQLAVLRRILAAQAWTVYGAWHRFAEIRDVDGFRERVPVNDYEALRPWIERQDRDGRPHLSAARPVSYAVTSGTTGAPKYIPILPSTLAGQKRIQDLFLHKLLEARPRVLDGHILAIVSPATEGRMPGSGLPFGSTSGQMYETAPSLVRAKYVVPSPVFGVGDYDTKYLLILRLALQHRDLSYITTANPSTLVRLVELLREHRDALLRDLEQGGFHRMEALAPEVRDSLRGRLEPRPERACELRALAANARRLRLRDVWPELQAVGVWTGGSSSIFFEALRGELAEHTLVRDVGYLSSEFRGAVPISSRTNAGIPSFQQNFFEFVRRDEWDAGEKRFLGLHQLVDGEQYYVFVTTDCGLYRYHMNDIVQVDGRYERVPLLRFVQKGKGVTNISGEKLYEAQVLAAVSKVEAAHGLASRFYVMAADERDARYRLCYEPSEETSERACQEAEAFAADLDAALAEGNLEYAAKRASGRIRTPHVLVLRAGSFDRYKRSCLARGQREGQFKVVALQYARELHFDFEAEAIAPDRHPRAA